jgi:hypothetical protein
MILRLPTMLWLLALFAASTARFAARAGEQEPKENAPADPAKVAVQAISEIADDIRACGEEVFINSTKEKKPRYYRVRWGPPTDVRFDVKASDSLVARFEGVIEFSIFGGISYFYPTPEGAKTGSDFPSLSHTTRHRHVFRVNDSGVQLDYRNYYDDRSQVWVLEQGTPKSCWERVGYK